MSRKLDESTRRAIESMTHMTQREISRRLKVSIGAVNGVLRGAKNRAEARDLAMRPAPLLAPAPAPAAPSQLDEARGRFYGALSLDESRAAAVALRRLESPEFARVLDETGTTAAAATADDLLVADFFSTPADLAYLAIHATQSLGMVERYPEDTEETYAAAVAESNREDRAAAVALLEGALAIVRQAPETDRVAQPTNDDETATANDVDDATASCGADPKEDTEAPGDAQEPSITIGTRTVKYDGSRGMREHRLHGPRPGKL